MVFCNQNHTLYWIKNKRHNPYFNRWFSAINGKMEVNFFLECVTILILIDGFLQYQTGDSNCKNQTVTILILIDGFLQ